MRVYILGQLGHDFVAEQQMAKDGMNWRHSLNLISSMTPIWKTVRIYQALPFQLETLASYKVELVQENQHGNSENRRQGVVSNRRQVIKHE